MVELSATGTPLGPSAQAAPGPQGEDPPCRAFAAPATCTRVGQVVWVLQASSGGWRLTQYDVDGELARWVPGLDGTGRGAPPTVTAVDLTPDAQPETLVAYPGSYDLLATGDAGLPAVVVHGQGAAAVEPGRVRVGGRLVRRVGRRWVAVPAA